MPAAKKERKPRLVPVPAKDPGRWEVVIPGFRPASLNELLGAGPWGAARLKRADRDHVILFGRLAGVPPATGKRRVSLAITLPPRRRRHDIDAFQKSTLDACTHAGLIRLDSPDWASWGGVEYSRGERLSTTIIIEDLP